MKPKNKITVLDTLKAIKANNRKCSTLFNKPLKTKDLKKHKNKYFCRKNKNYEQ